MGHSATFGAICAFAMALAAAPLAAQDTATTAAKVPEGGASAVVATVNGTPITLGHMIVLRANLPAQYQSLPDEILFKGILDQLVQQAALAQSVEGKTTLRDTLAMENDQRGYLSGVALQSVAGGAVTDEALQKAYDAKFANAAETKEYNAAHILVKTEEEAKELKTQIDAGADFADMAKQHSSDGAAANGGDLGWFSEGMMVKPFQDAVFAMEVGKVSDPVETQFGWHLIQLKETRIKSAPSLDDMREELAAEIEQAAVEAHIKSITDAAKIERPGEGFDPAVLRDQSLLDK
ncbi:peptidylprolyl isomerase [Pseudorhodobacter sp. E13]|uniref:peptidylprolyl isomerase n=1 Tax=Pseudorhodobacter sp. E13 TaxID=2487931 RepID=UPI000F8E171C|nr:peptidylprolyl isomerase [Pseudorhodobacter sp. E13]RUS58894.1 peptidylprolyl isomerase [Pseudorhodobacter sp. E13]